MTATRATARAAVSVWPLYPTLYQINTWVWLSELSEKQGKNVDLSSVPQAEWDAIAAYGMDAVWFMGVWERSPAGIAIANQNENLLNDFRRALPDFRPNDNVGSPYCVRRYVVDEHLGGPEGLAVAWRELSQRGMNLILDFVPNHVAPDHPWVAEHPEYFIRGNTDNLRDDPSSYMEVRGTVCACGRDPHFPAWRDVLQLNAFEPGLRQAEIETISSIAQQCDGIRCDMAMLFMNPIFERTWGGRGGPRPATEFWVDVISAIKKRHRGFLLSRRPIGTWNGRSSSRVSTSATTKSFMTGWSTTSQKISAFISVPILHTKESLFASSRITTSHEQRRPFHPKSSAPLH